MNALNAMLNRRLAILVVAAAVCSIGMGQSQASGPQATPTSHTPLRAGHIPSLRTSNGTSINWSGYAVSTTNVTSVSATFNVPQVGPPGSVGGFPPDFSAWVGIDGYTSNTVEQLGISGSWDDKTGTAIYYAWWEMYPRNSSLIKSMTLAAGDSVTARVDYNGRGSFTLSITDNTNGQAFSTTVSAPVGGPDAALRNSAEFIVERAATISKGYLTVLPLTTFTTAETFTNAWFTADGTTRTLQQAVNSFTEYANTANPPPVQPYWERMTVVGVDNVGNAYPLDAISSVTGNSFTATFLANGTALPLPGILRKN